MQKQIYFRSPKLPSMNSFLSWYARKWDTSVTCESITKTLVSAGEIGVAPPTAGPRVTFGCNHCGQLNMECDFMRSDLIRRRIS
jgi:hypothetical protein